MDLLKELMNAAGNSGLEEAGRQFGVDNSAMERVLGQVVPALGQGLKRNTASSGGLESLLGALKSGNHQKYLGNLGAAVSAAGIQDGNGILGHVFGSKDVSRQVAQRASGATGVDAGIIKQMLPVIATMVMGTLSKQTERGSQVTAQDSLGGLGALLDSDGDGSSVDDLLNLAGKFLK